MGLFSDPQYESMDFITQAIEPFETTLLSDYMTIPDQITLDNNDIQKLLVYSQHQTLYIEDLITHAINNNPLLRNSFSNNLQKNLRHLVDVMPSEDAFFEIVTDKLSQCEFTYTRDNLSNLNLTVTIRRTQCDLSKEYLLNFFAELLRKNLFTNYSRINGFNERLKELKSLFCIDRNVKFDTSIGQLKRMMTDLIFNDTLKIRSEDLILKVIYWMSQYANNNDSAALVNLTKLKILSHNNRAIYSVNEVI